jgi:SOS-response transcriptional repressor LexA
MSTAIEPAELTERQAEVLAYIVGRIAEDGGPPSYREIAGRFGFSAQSGVVCHLRALAKKGYLAWAKGRDRAVRVLRSPDGGPFVYPAPVVVPGLPSLTGRQEEMLRYVAAYAASAGYAPTVQEIMTHFGRTSPNWTFQMLGRIARKGYLARGPRGQARSLRVLALPPGDAP